MSEVRTAVEDAVILDDPCFNLPIPWPLPADQEYPRNHLGETIVVGIEGSANKVGVGGLHTLCGCGQWVTHFYPTPHFYPYPKPNVPHPTPNRELCVLEWSHVVGLSTPHVDLTHFYPTRPQEIYVVRPDERREAE